MTSAESTAISIRAIALNFLRSCDHKRQPAKTDSRKKPSYGIVKINVDASFHDDLLSGATGAIAQDDKGNFIATTSWFLPYARSVTSAEIAAIRNGLYLAANISCMKVEVESDSSLAVEYVFLGNQYLGADFGIVREYSTLAMEYTQIKYLNCPRDANQVVDGLVKQCFSKKSMDSGKTLFLIFPNLL